MIVVNQSSADCSYSICYRSSERSLGRSAMNRHVFVLAAALAWIPACVLAAPPSASAPPPPGIDEKGVEASAVAPGNEVESVKPTMPDTRPVRDKASRMKDQTASEIEASSDSVTKRQEGDDTVEEYREKGKIRMVRIIPRKGPAQTYYDRNGDGRLDRNPVDGPVSPVYFTIYEWN
jgi:hypothetical protein